MTTDEQTRSVLITRLMWLWFRCCPVRDLVDHSYGIGCGGVDGDLEIAVVCDVEGREWMLPELYHAVASGENISSNWEPKPVT